MRNTRHVQTPRRRLSVVLTLVALALGCSGDDTAKNGAKDGGGGDGSAAGDGGKNGADKDGGDRAFDTLDNGLPACGKDELTALPRPANVLLVIDESGSMTDKPTGFDDDKWTSLKGALGDALEAVQDDVSFGLELYPHSADSTPIALACSDDCCEMPAAPGITVPVGDGASHVDTILAALDASAPGGGTPTALALSRAHDYFTTGAGKALPGGKFVLLATDGGPNCNTKLSCDADACTTNLDGDCTVPSGNCCDPMFGGDVAKARCLDDAASLAQVQALAKAGIDTFVVGIPGSEAYADSLDEFAKAGGRPNPAAPPSYYAVTASGGSSGLVSTLSLITKNVITSCKLELGSTPQNPSQLNVYVDSKLVKRDSPDGWNLDETTMPPTIVLVGDACTKVQTMGAKSVRVLYGCPSVE